ncbi:MAG: hypothetical protein AB7F86_16635 [Bdellovibrionales bacterium]
MEMIENYSTLEQIFAISAAAGGLGYILSTSMQLIGGGDTEMDGHTASDALGEHDGGLADADVSFKFLSFQGITSFLLMFGLVGLAVSRGFSDVPPTISLVAGVKLPEYLGQVMNGDGSGGRGGVMPPPPSDRSSPPPPTQ